MTTTPKGPRTPRTKTKTEKPEQQLIELATEKVGDSRKPVIIPPEFQAIEKASGLGHEKAQAYLAMFTPYMSRIQEMENMIQGIDHENPTKQDSETARELRLMYVKNRTSAEKTKIEAKQSILIEGNLIQGCYNVIESTSKMKEEHLLKIEKHFEIQEQNRIRQLEADRKALLEPYGTDCTFLPLGQMDDNQFKALLDREKAYYEWKKSVEEQEEMERQEELARKQAEIDEADRKNKLHHSRMMDLLNERLEYRPQEDGSLADLTEEAWQALYGTRKQERAQKDQEEAEARAKQQAQEEALKKAQEQAEADRKAKEEAEAKLKAEQDRQEAEARAQEKARKDKEEADRKARLKAEQAPDKTKILEFAKAVGQLQVPAMKTTAGQETAKQIQDKIQAFQVWINKLAEPL